MEKQKQPSQFNLKQQIILGLLICTILYQLHDAGLYTKSIIVIQISATMLGLYFGAILALKFRTKMIARRSKKTIFK